MNNRANPRLVERLNRFTAGASLFAMAVGVSALVGWALGIEILKNWAAGPSTLKINTAVCFVLLGVSLWWQRKQEAQTFARVKKWVATAAAAASVLLGLLSAAEYTFNLSLGIDHWWSASAAGDRIGRAGAQLMSPITSLDFILLGMALLVLNWKTRRDRWPAQFLSLVALAAAVFGMLNFITAPQIAPLYISLSVPTAVTFIVFSFAVVCSRTEWGLGAVLASRNLGGTLLRQLAPPVLCAPVLIAFVRWKISTSGFLSEWGVAVLTTVLSVALLTGILGWAAITVDRNDAERTKIEEALQVGDQDLNRLLERFDESPNETILRHRVTWWLTVAMIAMCVLGLLSRRTLQQTEEHTGQVIHTQVVLKTLEGAITHLTELEAGSRAFSLSGHEPVLQLYRTGRIALGQDLETLRILTAGSPAQQRQLALLRPQVNAKITANADLVAARRQAGVGATAEQLDQGKRLLDAARATIIQMQAEEERTLEESTRKTRAAQHSAILVLALGSLLVLGFLAGAGFAIHRQIDVSVRANALNRDLNQRVQQRTRALEESQGRLAGVIQSAMDSIITVDEQQNIVMFNTAAEKTFRCSAAEAVGKSITRFIPQRFREAHAGHIAEFGKTGVTNRAMGALGKLWAVRADGEEFQIEASISQVDAAGKRLFTIILRDVSQREQIAAALRGKEEMLRLLLDGVKDYAVYMLDPEGRVASWNAGAARIKGYAAEEILGQPISVFYTPEQQANGVPANALHKATSEGRFEAEGPRIRKDGSLFWAHVVMLPMYDPAGKLRGFSKVLHDVTERKQAEEKLAAQAIKLSQQSAELMRSQQALETQSRMLQSVLDSMAEGLVATDEQGKFIIWNPAAERIVGMGAASLSSGQWSEHYGLFLDDMVTPFPAEQNPLLRAIQGEVSSAQMFVRNPALAQGTWVEANGGPLMDKNGAVCGGVVAFRDITHKRNAEREVRRLNEELELRVVERTAQLEEANKELESFTYSVAHDLRAPLRHIAGFSGILLEEFGPALNADGERYLQRIQEGTQRMGRLVDELLTLARVSRQAPVLQVTGLNSVVQEVMGILQPEISGRQVEWKIGDLPFVECDPTLLRQVFQNLISNALKYSRPRALAVIEIGQTQDSGQPVVFVRDNGVGFSMKYADKLFGVFQRLHRAEDFEGTGVGLATVQRIVKKHQGKVWAEAELDKGATFYFTLGGLQPSETKEERMTVGA